MNNYKQFKHSKSMTTKVKTTEIYNNSQDEHIVCKGKLVLLNENRKPHGSQLCYEINNKIPFIYDGRDNYLHTVIKPIIISETEEIETGDKVLMEDGKIKTNGVDVGIKYRIKSAPYNKKILALPEQFSPEQLQDIVDGKIKDGDKVYVECRFNTHGEFYKNDEKWSYMCKLTDSYIKLFAVKKEATWNEVFQILGNPDVSLGTKEAMVMERYNPPTKK